MYLRMLQLARLGAMFHGVYFDKDESGNGGGGGSNDLEWTDEHQARLNAQVTARLARQKEQMESEYATQLAELETLRADKAKRDQEAEAERQAKLQAEGDHQKLFEETTAQHEKKVESLESTITGLQGQLENLVTSQTLSTAIQKVEGANPKLASHVRRALLDGSELADDQFVKVAPSKDPNNNVMLKVVGRDGNQVLKSNGDLLSVDEAVSQYYQHYPEFLLATSRGGAGSGGNGGQTSTPSAEVEKARQRAEQTGRSSDILDYQRLKRQQAAQGA